jgi:hypothetical protein
VQQTFVAAKDTPVRLKMHVVGSAHMFVDLPDGSEEMLRAIEYDLPRDIEDFLADLGIHNVGEVDFLNHLYSLEVDSFKVEPDDGAVTEEEMPR